MLSRKYFSFLFIVQWATAIRVELPLGSVEGRVELSFLQRKYYSFEGLPYALPPVGEQRFKAPVPLKSWPGTWVAKTPTRCMQYNHYTKPGEEWVVGDEDCLHLNIYTPDLDSTAYLDVIVYIHGGAFMFNYGALYRPDFLMDRPVVLVTLNYRLGPLGFLSTESDVVPGNNGIRDQILAMQWVKSYIEYFGGNKDSITLIGNSAGGASVHLHNLIPQSRDLFNRGFAQSGTALNPWVLMEQPLAKFQTLSQLVGCNDTNVTDVLECLRKRPAKQIVATVEHFQWFLYNPFSPFGVVVEGDWSSDPVLSKHPYLLLEQRKVHDKPLLISHTNAEGLYPFADFYDEDLLQTIDNNWNSIIPHVLDYYYTVNKNQLDEVSQKIRQAYLDDAALTLDNFDQFVRIGTDRIFVQDIQKAAKLHAAASQAPVYFYYFTYRGAHSKSEVRTGSTLNFGAAHADDPCYFLKCTTSVDFASTEKDREMVNLFLDLITSFAQTGRPKVRDVKWPRLNHSKNGITRLLMNSPDDLTVDTFDYENIENFWNSLPIYENEKLFPGENNHAKDEL